MGPALPAPGVRSLKVKMKKQISIAVIALALFAVALSVRSQQQSTWAQHAAELSQRVPAPPAEEPSAVVLQADTVGYSGSQFVVLNISRSGNAPDIKEGDDLAEALAKLRAAHFTITVHAWGWMLYTATR